jgi:hypothetical protein
MNWVMAFAATLGLATIVLVATVYAWEKSGNKQYASGPKETHGNSL